MSATAVQVVLATNIAESSVTIPGIRFVVDGGLSKVREFNATTGLETLMVARISQQQVCAGTTTH